VLQRVAQSVRTWVHRLLSFGFPNNSVAIAPVFPAAMELWRTLRFLLSMRRVLLLSVGALLVAAAQTPALRKGVSVQMPVTTNADPAPDADRADSLIVAVTFRGAVFLGATPVTPAQLSEQVKAQLNSHPGNRTYLKADARTPYSSVSEVLDALRTAGVNAPILLTARLDDSTDGTYVSPKGLEVLLAPAPMRRNRTMRRYCRSVERRRSVTSSTRSTCTAQRRSGSFYPRRESSPQSDGAAPVSATDAASFAVGGN
jgi:biopolymer transport protein ExbD